MTVDELKRFANGNADDKVLINPQIHIEGNIISSINNLIQISNISKAWAGPIQKSKLSSKSILIMAVLGFFGFFLIATIKLSLFGLAIWGVIGYIIYKHVSQPQYHAISFELNSGRVYSFTSNDQIHIDTIFRVISGIIKDNSGTADIIINFGNGTIVNNSENVTNY